MNKDELEMEFRKLKKSLDNEKASSNTIMKSNREMRKLAEEAGSELAIVKQELIRYKDKYGETL